VGKVLKGVGIVIGILVLDWAFGLSSIMGLKLYWVYHIRVGMIHRVMGRLGSI
jgi:hypothetical protein